MSKESSAAQGLRVYSAYNLYSLGASQGLLHDFSVKHAFNSDGGSQDWKNLQADWVTAIKARKGK